MIQHWAQFSYWRIISNLLYGWSQDYLDIRLSGLPLRVGLCFCNINDEKDYWTINFVALLFDRIEWKLSFKPIFFLDWWGFLWQNSSELVWNIVLIFGDVLGFNLKLWLFCWGVFVNDGLKCFTWRGMICRLFFFFCNQPDWTLLLYMLIEWSGITPDQTEFTVWFNPN